MIKKYLVDNNIPIINRLGKSYLVAIENGYRASGIRAQGFSNWTKKHFPDKPKGVKLKNYILNILNKKYCTKCCCTKELSEFSKNKSKADSYNSWCKSCTYSAQLPTASYNTAKRKAAKLKATPPWADLEKIKEFYNNCPEGYHVDHIIPLQGERVRGLHILHNLQYLPAKENLSKGNKF